jgi:hypothetical protein
MRTFNEFVESKNIDPILESITVLLAEYEDPWQAVRQYCRQLGPQYELAYVETMNMCQLEEGFGDVMRGVGNWASGAWDRFKNSTTGRALGAVGNTAVRAGAGVWDAAKQAGYATADQAGNVMKQLSNPSKHFNDTVVAVQSLVKSLQTPEMQQLRSAGKLGMADGSDMLTFFTQMLQTLQQNKQAVNAALEPKTYAAKQQTGWNSTRQTRMPGMRANPAAAASAADADAAAGAPAAGGA